MTTEPTQPFQPVAPEPTPQPIEGPPLEPVPASRPKPRSATPGWINVALGLAVAVAIGGVAFAAGRLTAPTAVAGANDGFGRNVPGGFQGGGYFRGGYFGGPGEGQGGRGLFGAGGATVEGTVTSISADKITVTTAGGQTIDIALDGSTTYHLESSASSGDVKTGGTVIVRLTLRQAGSTLSGPSASDITIVP